jgi:hypothetical protein
VWRILEDIGAEATAALERELTALQCFLDGVVLSPRFPVPLDRQLRA